jgi:hypothetical protein
MHKRDKKMTKKVLYKHINSAVSGDVYVDTS